MFDNLFNFKIEILAWSAIVFFAVLIHIVIGTVRVIMMVKGNRTIALIMGFTEAAIGLFNAILVVSNAVKSGINLYIIFFYSLGFAAGLGLGMFISQKISRDILSITIIPSKSDSPLEDILRENGFGVTCYQGSGKEGNRRVLSIISQKSNLANLKKLVTAADKKAMLAVHTIDGLTGGFLLDIKNKI
jgi:uncharacterized protein YebE (UPF0316 family)